MRLHYLKNLTLATVGALGSLTQTEDWSGAELQVYCDNNKVDSPICVDHCR